MSTTKQKTIETLVTNYLAWAEALGIRYINAHNIPKNEEDDILSAAREGLCIAAKKFKPERDVHFSTYASFWVLGRILNYLKMAWGTPQMKANPNRRSTKQGDYVFCLDDVKNNICFSVNGTEKRICDDNLVKKILATLPSRLVGVLKAHYMDGYNMREIGDQMGLTRERVRQLRNEGLELAAVEARKLQQRSYIDNL